MRCLMDSNLSEAFCVSPVHKLGRGSAYRLALEGHAQNLDRPIEFPLYHMRLRTPNFNKASLSMHS